MKKINKICKELIKSKVINENGKIDTNQIDNKNLNQEFLLEINEEFKLIKQKNESLIESSDKILGLDFKEMQTYLVYINEKSFCFDKKNIEERKEEYYKRITREVMKNLKKIIDILVNNLVNKYNKYIDKKFEEEKKKKVVPKIKTNKRR